jgi:hypothetical protein
LIWTSHAARIMSRRTCRAGYIFGYIGGALYITMASAVRAGFKCNHALAEAQKGRVQTHGYPVSWKEDLRRLLVEQDIYVTKIESFRVTFINVFDKYILPNVNTEATIGSRRSTPIQFRQNAESAEFRRVVCNLRVRRGIIPSPDGALYIRARGEVPLQGCLPIPRILHNTQTLEGNGVPTS